MEEKKPENRQVELLEELIREQKNSARSARYASIAALLLVIVLLAGMLAAVPPLLRAADRVDALADQAQATMAEAENAILQAKDSLSGIDTAVKNINGLVEDNAEDVNKIVQEFSQIDLDGFSETAELLKELDVQAFKESMEKLAGVAELLSGLLG